MPPLVFVAIAWVAGLVAAHHWLVPVGVEPASLVVLCLLPLGVILLWRKDASMRLSAACALAFLLAALRYQAALPDLNDPSFVAHYNDGSWRTLEGVVDGYPDVRDTWTGLRVASEWLVVDGERLPVRGYVLVRAPRFPEFHYGDRLQVSGLLETPPEFSDFSYREYLARKGLYSYIGYPRIAWLASGEGSAFWTAIFALKDRASDAIARLMPEPTASLLQGILLGIRTGIPTDLYDEFNATGTSHVLVISGSNITIVATLFALVFGRIVGKRRAYWFTIAGIGLYVLLVGAEPAVVRAGIMGGLFVTALYLGRHSTAYVALLTTVVVLTVIKPLSLWDVGFQLSFGATLGLILFAPAIERFFERGLMRVGTAERARSMLRPLNEALALTLSAMILTLPLVVYHFGRLSLVAPLANLLIVPVQMPIMVVGGVATVVGLVPWLEPAVRVLFWVPWLLLTYTTAVVRWLASWPFASLEVGPVRAIWLVLYYLLLLGMVWFYRQRKDATARIETLAEASWFTRAGLGLLLLAGALLWIAVGQLPDGRLHVAFLDVGQGDAILITTTEGQQILVDGGPSPAALTSALGREMPFWDRSLDLVVMSHADADHITGLAEVVERYRLDGWLDNGFPDEDAVYLQCLQSLEERGVPRHTVRAGDRLDLGEGSILEVLHPPPEPMTGTDADSNNNSIVLRLRWKEAAFLLTGDIEAEAERLLLQSGQPLDADVLKVAHHGSGGSSTPEFLSAVAPSFAAISVGVDNRFDHPAPIVLERLAAAGGVTIHRTDEEGTLEFVTDGQNLWVRTQRR